MIDNWVTSDTVVIHRGDLSQGFAILQPLVWDTEILQLKCARLHAFCVASSPRHSDDVAMNLAMEVRKCIEQSNIDLIDHKISTRDLYKGRFLEVVGFHLVDVLCTLHAMVQDYPSPKQKHVRFAIEKDLEPLKRLSSEVYGDLDAIQDRFYLEPSIKPENAGRIFEAWFENSYKKQVQGEGIVFVYDEGSGPLGYLAIEKLPSHIRDKAWYDSLNAVSEEARGRGVYKSLMGAAFHHLRSEGQADLITKTQISNQRVINSWLHSGANIIESSATYHWTKHL
jgi:GNAT superfamily N-acetyltransferase